jgi:hypothetical protein
MPPAQKQVAHHHGTAVYVRLIFALSLSPAEKCLIDTSLRNIGVYEAGSNAAWNGLCFAILAYMNRDDGASRNFVEQGLQARG